MASGNKRGRKNLYESRIKPHLPEILEMCKTMTEKQIAETLGVGYSTFNQYKLDYPELAEVLKKGRQNLVADLRSALIRRAKGYAYTEKKTVVEAVKWDSDTYMELLDAGFTPEKIASSRLVRTEISEKSMAPDVAALNLALKNYDKENWSNDPQMLEIRKKELKLREKQIEKNDW